MTMASTQTQTTIHDAVEHIQTAVNLAGFSMKFASKDQLDQQFYDEDTDPLSSQYIHGVACFHPIPRGIIVYTKKNTYRMACANLYFMEKNNVVPISLTNIPEKCNLLRSDGRIHRGRIPWNEGLFFHDNYGTMMLRICFYGDETKTVISQCLSDKEESKDSEVDSEPDSKSDSKSDSDSDSDSESNSESDSEYLDKLYNKSIVHNWGDMSKGMKIDDFMRTNNMDKLVIKLNTIDIKKYLKDDLPQNGIHQELIQFFNNNFKTWIFDSLTKKLIQSNISATILLDGVEVFTHKVK